MLKKWKTFSIIFDKTILKTQEESKLIQSSASVGLLLAIEFIGGEKKKLPYNTCLFPNKTTLIIISGRRYEHLDDVRCWAAMFPFCSGGEVVTKIFRISVRDSLLFSYFH